MNTQNQHPRVSGRALAIVVWIAICVASSLSWMAMAGENLVGSPLNPPGAVSKKMGFTRLTPKDTGLDFQNLLKPENIRKYLYNGAGGCAGDFDGDGRTDLYLVSQDGPNKLFRQVDRWTFTDHTDKCGVDGGDNWGAGACFVDVDNDRDLDLHVSNQGSPDLLYINQGDGTFREEGAARGLAYSGPSVMSAFCDFDRDGDLDCYLVTYRLFQLAESDPEITIRYVDGKPTVHPDFADQYRIIDGHLTEMGKPDRLFRNDGKGNFTDISGAAGLGEDWNHGLSATWFDFNNDRWPDLYVASDFKDEDRLWRNNGDGTFSDALPEMATYSAWFAMGSDFGDINRDGWFDLIVADMSAMNHYRQKMEMGEMGRSAWFLEWGEPRQYMRNMVYLNAGGNRFLETGFQSGLESTGWTWATRFADLDCDGWEDAVFCNGMSRDVNNSDFLTELKRLEDEGNHQKRKEALRNYTKSGSDRNQVFRNRGDATFENVSEEWGYHDLSTSYGLILADLDRDGDLDLVTNNMNEPVGVYRNDQIAGNRVLLELRGRQSNSLGIGAQVRVKSASGVQSRIMTVARGYQSGHEPVIHVGLGDDPEIEELTVYWPGGARQILEKLDVNQIYTITEPEGDFVPGPNQKMPRTRRSLFSSHPVPGLRFRHRENEYDDYKKEPLLPWKLSRFGPGLAVGDADADGDEDLWVGGAAGQEGRILLQNDDGKWTSTNWGPWGKDAASEDMGALFFDPDRDGDLDLYVASGGRPDKDSDLEDRLYLNMEIDSGVGEGTPAKRAFARANSDLDPRKRAFLSSGVVAAADYDEDGDLDLFVGSRLIPGEFPDPPVQRFLRNDGDQFVDVIDEIAPTLREAGLVTGALWSDVDNNGRLDLLVTNAWGPIRLFRQSQSGQFTEATKASGLSEDHGWWQGIDGGDIDGDGDMDFVVTNLGRNTKYHASKAKPFLLYAGDFDENGTRDIVEAEYEGDILFPVRGRSCSSAAMPFIQKKFETFHDYAMADLPRIYSSPKLEKARVVRFTNLDCSILINDGSGKFALHSLPLAAQIAPGFGVVVEDFDGDGKLDVVIAQNFYSPQLETGRMSGGLGVFLKGDGDGSFTEVGASESGIRIHEDAKSLAKADLNSDGAPDLIWAINDGEIKTLTNLRGGPAVRWTTVILEGGRGNLTGIGSRIEIETSEGRRLMKEVRAGGSYLSQSTPRQFVGLSKDEHVAKVTVRWPGGKKSEVSCAEFETRVRIGAEDQNNRATQE